MTKETELPPHCPKCGEPHGGTECVYRPSKPGNDLVAELRSFGSLPEALYTRAADEIERLRAELLDTTWQDHADRWHQEAFRLRATLESTRTKGPSAHNAWVDAVLRPADETPAAQVIPDGWCPICGSNDGGHKPGCEDGSEVL